MRTVIPATLLALGLLLPSGAAWSQDHDHPAGDEQVLGEVEFPTSCDPAVQERFDRAVAMLHSFWYKAAERRFAEIVESDPECAMARWGVAMSRFRQLWTAPGEEDLRAGRAAIEKARSIDGTTERERDYVEALFAFYEGNDRDHLERKITYEKAMEELHRRHPDDPEAAIFHALAILGVAYFSPPDDSFARQKKAGSILEEVFAERPRHPGIAHYLIHSYDFPELAARGEEAARQYAEIAPSAPHALHMPSHIFTRLGLWEESIESNRAAAAAAHEDGWYGEELHASDYLTYAYLQMGRDAEAEEMLRKVPTLTGLLREDDTNYGAGLYAAAAIPARYAVERREWKEAAALTAPTDLPGGPLCWTEGPRRFARGLGAIHTGDLEKARQAVAALERCEDVVTRGVWAARTEVLRRALAAWLAWAEGREEEALAEMRSAADLEDASDKPPTTPGSVVPARELLAEMLLAAGRPAEALGAFEASMEESPRRFGSLLGAARAACEAGDEDVARAYYARLLELAASDARRPEIEEAKRFAGSGVTFSGGRPGCSGCAGHVGGGHPAARVFNLELMNFEELLRLAIR